MWGIGTIVWCCRMIRRLWRTPTIEELLAEGGYELRGNDVYFNGVYMGRLYVDEEE